MFGNFMIIVGAVVVGLLVFTCLNVALILTLLHSEKFMNRYANWIVRNVEEASSYFEEEP